jgi:aldose 1-epimerase
MTMQAPSGVQYELRNGDQSAVVVEVGASLRAYSVGGRDVIVPFGADEIAPASHGAVLLPWPNRLRDGRYSFDGVDYSLPLTEPGRMTALHGLACWQRWTPVDRSAASVTLALDLVPVPGYPFELRCEITYELGDAGLGIRLSATNLSDRDAPYGAGFHPWLSPGPGSVDECLFRIDAQQWIRTDERLLPVGAEPIPQHFDFRKPRVLGGTEFDDAFVDATFADGLSWITLRGSDGLTAATWMDSSMTCWQVCTGDAVALSRYRRAGVAAEPMTCIADAFRTGDKLIRLAPGQASTVRWGLSLLRD